MDKKQLRKLVAEVITYLGLHSAEAEDLIMGTIAQESHLGKYIEQIKGPAKGICQMEPATYEDIWANFLKYKPSLEDKILRLSVDANDADEMRWNLKLAIAMCRVHYLRVKSSIPLTLDGQAHYWKNHYNTYLGAGTPEEYIRNYKRFAE